MCSVVTTGAFNSRSRVNKWLPAGPPKIPNSCWTRHNVHVAGVQEVGGAPVRIQVLLLNLEANDVRILVAALDVIDRHREAAALGMPRRHRSQQVGGKRGDAAFARQVVAEKRNGSNAWRSFHGTGLRGIDESLASILCLPSIAIGSFLALDTTRRPWHGGEAFWADRLFAVDAGSEAAVVNPPQCGLHLAQQSGLAVYVSDRQIAFRRILNLVHLVRALLDGDAVPVSQYPHQFGLFSFEDLLDPAFCRCYRSQRSSFVRNLLLSLGTGWSIT